MFAHVCPELWSVLEGCGIFRKLSLAGEVGYQGQVSRFGSSSQFPVGSLLPACGHTSPSTSCFCCPTSPATVHGSFLKLEVEIVASSLKLLLVVIATRKVTICYMFEVLEFTLKWAKIVFLFVCLYLCMCVYVCTSLWQPGVDTRWLPPLLCPYVLRRSLAEPSIHRFSYTDGL